LRCWVMTRLIWKIGPRRLWSRSSLVMTILSWW
jgi:hypothetical protein